MRLIWGSEAPFGVASTSGMKVQAWYRANIGPPDDFVAGVAMDMGDGVEMPSGEVIEGLCPIKATAAEITFQSPKSHIVEHAPDFLLWAAVLDDVLAIPRPLLTENLDSRATELVIQMGEGRGLPDSWPILCKNAAAAYHLLYVCQDPEEPSEFVYRFNVVHSALEGEVYFSPKTAHKLRDWTFDTNNRMLEVTPALVVCPVQLENDRHSLSMRTKRTSFREVVADLALIGHKWWRASVEAGSNC
jgi:hypothetical protein